jgi:hypothetical protein
MGTTDMTREYACRINALTGQNMFTVSSSYGSSFTYVQHMKCTFNTLLMTFA